jgi:hypothetical protein
VQTPGEEGNDGVRGPYKCLNLFLSHSGDRLKRGEESEEHRPFTFLKIMT